MPALDPAFLKTPIAHRALHDASQGIYENCRSAIIAAIEQGYAIEIDSQLSSDGRAIRVPLLIELKDQGRKLSQTDGRLEQATVNALSLYQGAVAVMSFNPHMIENLAKLSSDLPLGLTTGSFMDPSWGIDAERIAHLSQITDFDPKRHSFVSHFALELAAPCIQTLKEQGTVIFTWTIRSPEAEAIARQTVDNITFESYLPLTDRLTRLQPTAFCAPLRIADR